MNNLFGYPDIWPQGTSPFNDDLRDRINQLAELVRDWDRCRNEVYRVIQTPIPPFPDPLPPQPFWARIVDSEAGFTNRWLYTGQRVRLVNDEWEDITGDQFDMLNTVEYQNDGEGIEGYGVDITGTEDYTINMLRVRDGSIVLVHPVVTTVNEELTTQYWFTAPNDIEVNCQ
jgi:hypothetical protein